jgi:UDP-3-O-[3-hydroxymyristoyl] glucosamine N-acyltransferase
VAPGRILLGKLAAELGLALDGDPDLPIRGVASLGEAGADELSFVRSSQYVAALEASRAGAVVAPVDLEVGPRSVLRSSDPGRDFYRAARILVPPTEVPPGIDATASVAPDARVDPTAAIGPGCIVGRGAVIGARTRLHAGTVVEDAVEIGEDCELCARSVVTAASVLGDRVVLQPGAVVGGAGFGYVGGEEGGLRKAYDLGRVVLGDDVEVGANSAIDRGTLGDTRVGRGTKIDNLVQIGHNCDIGEDVIIVAQVGLAGSVRVENGAIVLAQAGVAGHKTLGERAVIGPQAGIHRDVPAGKRVAGMPERPHGTYYREMAALSRLPELIRRVRALERSVASAADDGEGDA